jgi:alpha-L-fucosidase
MNSGFNICRILWVLLYTITIQNSFGQSSSNPRLQWWQEARFGMFIHWGPVSLKGTEIGWSRGVQVPVKEYDQLYALFNPTSFSAKEWVSIAKAAGMKYIVLTAKHYDGFCLWDTETTDYNIMNTPFGRDVVKELAEECKKQGIIFCTYYSILDWYHPDYNIDSRGGPGYQLPAGEKANMDRYQEYLKNHMKELIQHYGPLGVMWYDGEWETPWTHEMGLELYEFVRGLQDDIIINNRVDKGRKGMEGITLTDMAYAGDFDTPEQEVGKFQTERPWETCMTIAQQWACKPNDQLKTLEECLHILIKTAGGDGNLLLNVGPMPNGAIEERQVARLKEIGDWLNKYGESIYGTRGGPFMPDEWGVSTTKDNKIFVHVLKADDNELLLAPLDKKVIKCYLFYGSEQNFSQNKNGISISLNNLDTNAIDNIFVLELEH